MPTDHGPRPRSRRSARPRPTSAPRSRGRDRATADAEQCRAAAGVQAECASRAAESGERPVLGGAWSRVPTAGVAARMIRRSIARASRARISWPQSARRSAWATVAVRTAAGRQVPRRRPDQRVAPETAQELGVVVRRERGRSGAARGPARLAARRTTSPSGRCQACASSWPSAPSTAAVTRPSWIVRVASPIRRHESART